ncbi:uncharacterized protein LOC135165343 [Diachasmimorpha longicaudata]|uniref:uncharacterized protein LOC135165343 n=1 Tax=Diachasmimorpha longicaudata TaxID=58733 RepID=UPI0030B8AA7D
MNGQIGAFLCTLCITLTVALPTLKPGCTVDKCAGPIKYYNDIGCEPVYKDPEDCCPLRYNCDHLNTRSDDKCYAFGHEYNPTEDLRDEDKGCNRHCTCIKPDDNPARFSCALHAVPYIPITPGCFRPQDATACAPGPETCPPNPEDIAKCEVDGKTYLDGQYFQPEGEPRKSCYCGPDYKGENVAPFCKDYSLENCGIELWNGDNIRNRCAPVFSMGQDPRLDCHHDWRCQEDGDKVEPRDDVIPDPPGISMDCQIGNFTMKFGDEVNHVSGDSCIKCRCDLPPLPTCAAMPKAICSMTAADLEDSDEKKP